MVKASKPRAQQPSGIALALAGGGPLGAIYEVGALCALEESLVGLDFTRLQHYVGVSAGAFIAAGLANGITPRQLCASFIENDHRIIDVFDPAWLMRPAYDEFARRAVMLPGLLLDALWQFTVGRKSLARALERLSPALPTGLFSNEELQLRLAEMYAKPGRTNDFRQLKTRLTLVATHLDTGEAAPFGSPGWDHVPISRAVQASAALPGLFPPVEIDDKYYVDGALKKTMHASVVMDEGAELVLCLNPLVPFNAMPQVNARASAGRHRIPKIVDGGLPLVLSQTFRSMIHSRMALGMKHYEHAYPNSDIVLLEPDHSDAELYMANTFSYSQRRHLAEHAYQQTRSALRENQGGLVEKLARHGIHLRTRVLEDRCRHLLKEPDHPTAGGRALQRLRRDLEWLEQWVEPHHHPVPGKPASAAA